MPSSPQAAGSQASRSEASGPDESSDGYGSGLPLRNGRSLRASEAQLCLGLQSVSGSCQDPQEDLKRFPSVSSERKRQRRQRPGGPTPPLSLSLHRSYRACEGLSEEKALCPIAVEFGREIEDSALGREGACIPTARALRLACDQEQGPSTSEAQLQEFSSPGYACIIRPYEAGAPP